jgi:hypothetical protein
MRPNAGPFALTQDAAPSGESPLTYSTSPFYSRLSWSPDGSSLAFTDEHGNLFVATSGKAVNKIASVPTADFIGAWSADGSEIAYAVRADNGAGQTSTYQVQAIPRNGGQPRYVGTFPLFNGGIGFMPHDLSQAIATQDSLVYSGTFVWTKMGIVHSIATNANLGLALDSFDGKEIWNLNVNHTVVSPDQTRAVAIQGQQVVAIDLASGKATPLPIQTTPDAMAWSSDSQTIYYSTSTKLSEVTVNQNTPGAQKIQQLDGGLPADSAVSNNVQLWSLPASGGTPTALLGQEGYGIAWISASPVPNNALIAFSFVTSSAKLFTDANAGKTDLSQDYPTIRVGTVVPGQAPNFFDSPSRKPLISAAAEFVAVPVGSGAPAAANAAPSTCSPASNTAATITVTNKTGQTVLLMWLDFNCNEQQYNSIAPGVSVTQGTFTGHVWRIEDAASHKVLKEFKVTQNATITVP